MRFPVRSAIAALAFVVAVSLPVSAQFQPARSFPDTWGRIGVFVDQLPSLNEAQAQFAATHYAGTQKQRSSQIQQIRRFNQDFLHIQYRLGYRVSEPVFIHNDDWTNDLDTINAHEDWFVHDQQGNRVKNIYAGTVDEFIMDVDHPAFRDYYLNTVAHDIEVSQADGWFADSTHLPTGVPQSLWDSPLGAAPHTPFIDEMERWYDHIYADFNRRNRYFIPNIGNLVTTLDTTTGYYQDVHGAMVEGFGITVFGAADWRLQMNRTLQLVNNDKILIAQNDVEDASDVHGRMWLLTNYLLVKRDHSYVNILAPGVSQLHWWPEYDIDLGAPVQEAKFTDIGQLDPDGDGVYEREFARGRVLVNGTASTKTAAVGRGTWQIVPSGGGQIGEDGQWIAPGTLTEVAVGPTITLPPFSGIVLATRPRADINGDGAVDAADAAMMFAQWGTTGSGDLNGDSVVDAADAGELFAHWTGDVQSVPEPHLGLLIVLSAVLAFVARRPRGMERLVSRAC